MSHWWSSYHVLGSLLNALHELLSCSLIAVLRDGYYYASFTDEETEAYWRVRNPALLKQWAELVFEPNQSDCKAMLFQI